MFSQASVGHSAHGEGWVSLVPCPFQAQVGGYVQGGGGVCAGGMGTSHTWDGGGSALVWSAYRRYTSYWNAFLYDVF